MAALGIAMSLRDEDAAVATKDLFGSTDGVSAVLVVIASGTRLRKDDPRVKFHAGGFVPVLPQGLRREDALLATATMRTIGHGDERTVHAGQLVPRDDPMVHLHPHHFQLPPFEE
jgi:hypothetical protein